MIEVNNLVKKFGDHVAVDHISFTVDKGQVVGFLGPNGAGKSTTMNIITGYISATEGNVIINGYDVYDEPEEAKKCIGYLPELPPVYPDMTVREYLGFVADLKKVNRAEKAEMIEEIMDRIKIKSESERLIKYLSKGYRQRVGLAQAIIGYPELLILDEPTVGLDPAQIIEIRDLIKELAQKHTIIISSHILSEISEVCDTIMIINKGKLVASDRPENLSKHLGGTDGIELKIKGDKAAINDVLKSLGTISKVTYKRSSEEGIAALTAYSKGEDIREKLFYTMAEAKLPIMEMHVSNMSLEDIFLEVTKEDDALRKPKKKKVAVKQDNSDDKEDNHNAGNL